MFQQEEKMQAIEGGDDMEIDSVDVNEGLIAEEWEQWLREEMQAIQGGGEDDEIDIDTDS